MRAIHSRLHRFISTAAVALTTAVLFLFPSCNGEDDNHAPVIQERDSLPFLRTEGVSTLISDSGIIRYKIIAEEWLIYSRERDFSYHSYWSFEKGLFLEKFNEDYHIDAFVTADTAYYHTRERLWELRGRVEVKNVKGETFRTSLLYWNQNERRVYSDRYMEIDGLEQQLSGYDFSSNEAMTDYLIHSSTGAFPIKDDSESPHPDADKVAPTDSMEASPAAVQTTTTSVQATP